MASGKLGTNRSISAHTATDKISNRNGITGDSLESCFKNIQGRPSHIPSTLLIQRSRRLITRAMAFNIATLVLRLAFGLSLALAHGLPKLMSFAEHSAGFPDPLGIGPVVSMGLVVFAEFFCSLLVAFGAFTRFTAIPVVILMAVA